MVFNILNGIVGLNQEHFFQYKPSIYHNSHNEKVITNIQVELMLRNFPLQPDQPLNGTGGSVQNSLSV